MISQIMDYMWLVLIQVALDWDYQEEISRKFLISVINFMNMHVMMGISKYDFYQLLSSVNVANCYARHPVQMQTKTLEYLSS